MTPMLLLPRAQLFEFNDRDWVPESLRDAIVETLSRSLDWGGTNVSPSLSEGRARIIVNAFKITFASVAYERLDADLVEQGPVALGVIA